MLKSLELFRSSSYRCAELYICKIEQGVGQTWLALISKSFRFSIHFEKKKRKTKTKQKKNEQKNFYTIVFK